jgi:tRNA (adenine-N(1)-)-methyltransferase non-catalytic subunit
MFILQVVTELQSTLRDVPHWLGPAVTESWLRQYQVPSVFCEIASQVLNPAQVLPGRTHPMMNTSGSGGFLLHAIKMCVEGFATCPVLTTVFQI